MRRDHRAIDRSRLADDDVGGEAVIVAPVATGATISTTLTAVAFDEGIDARPGPWSPDGQAMVAFVTVGEN
ncbi:MAG: hypothetical protein OQK68_06935, partial [Sedimenticola sp.]|nr:hypothetical protein [Sedimenticola sp.]